MAHVQSSRHILDEFAKALEDIALVDKAGRRWKAGAMA